MASKIADSLKTNYQVIVSTDYGPMGILADVAHECNVSEKVFPWKTVMWIEEGSVKVRAGYSAQIETLYPQEEHV